MTLWSTITGNSTLPVQAGNTFWDHLNNQKTGTGNGISGDFVCLTTNNLSSILTETETGHSLNTKTHNTMVIDRPDNISIAVETTGNTEYTNTLNTNDLNIDKIGTRILTENPSVSITKIINNSTDYKDRTDG